MSELLTTQDLAEMWRCSVRHARDVLVKTPGFPEPAPGSPMRGRVWLRAEVLAFANRRAPGNTHGITHQHGLASV